jgi:tetratricopeptide (TPR) repeat protein
MRQVPPNDEVRRYLELGFAHLEPGDSEERARLLVARSMLGFATFGRGFTVEQLEEGRRDGEEAAAMAERLGLPELQSAALDGVGATFMMQGRPAAMTEVDERRLRLVPFLADPAELGDLYSNAALARIQIGRFRDALELGKLGVEAALAEAPSFGTYSIVWMTVADFRLGNWDEAIAGHDRLLGRLGDRDDPPRPWLQSFAIAALIADARGDRERSDRELAVVLPGAKAQSNRTVTGATWAALLLARRGRTDEARRWLDETTLPETQPSAAEIRCDVIALAAAWSEAPAAIDRAAEVAERAGSLSLPVYARRLEGRAALAAGDVDAAIRSLSEAVEGFERLEARWERACAQLSLALALAAAARRADAQASLDEALLVFEEVRSLEEIERAKELRAQLA